MKILFQELCINKTNWDAELNRELLEQWKSILQDMSLMYSCMVLVTHQNVPTPWLFMLEATTMMVNLRFDWLLLKRRVAPIKRQTIPRLKLLGAPILAHLANKLKSLWTVPKQRPHNQMQGSNQ